MPYTLTVLTDPLAFLRVANERTEIDTDNMNMVLGPAMDSAYGSTERSTIWIVLSGEGELDSEIVVRDAWKEGDGPILLAMVSPTLQTYFLSTVEPGTVLPNAILATLVEIVRNPLEDGLPKRSVQSVVGPKQLIRGFLEEWAKTNDPPLKVQDEAFLVTNQAHRPSTANPQVIRELAEEYTIKDILDIPDHHQAQLVKLIIEFWEKGSEESNDAAMKMIKDVVDNRKLGRLWICLKGDEAVGYAYTGRETNKTIAIRHVYVRSEDRGKGIAEHLVRSASTEWLQKGKQEITLCVEPDNPAALKVYKRCGFIVGEELWERRGFEGISRGEF